MYTSIIHLSDTHIKTGDLEKSRYDEYSAVFQNLFKALSIIDDVKNKQAIIVITGDLFHHKGKLEPAGLSLIINLLTRLSGLAPVYIIRGNHDFRQDLPDEPDMISAVMSYQIPNVFYLDKTGHYTIGNIGVGLTAIQDTLLYGARSEIERELVVFPEASALDTEYKVALFHGSVIQARLQNGSVLSEEMNGYPLEWFKKSGYEYVLLGDIHLQQIHGATSKNTSETQLPNTVQTEVYTPNKTCAWAYPGSLVQQDFGETLLGHGFIHWNLKEKKIVPYHVYNPYGYVTACYTNSEINILHRVTGKSTWVRLGAIVGKEWFPHKIRLRFTGNNLTREHKTEIETKFREAGKEIISSSEITPSQISNTYDEKTEDSSIEMLDVRTITSADMWIQYIINNNDTEIVRNTNSWHQWFKNPETLVIPTKGVEGNILKKIQERNAKIISLVETLQTKIDKSHNKTTISGKITLQELNWNWILNYGKDNHFNFTKNQGKIYVLNGKNGNGKSNFMETICIALFGEGYPSRYNKSYGADLICNKKPDGEMAFTGLTFALNGEMYHLSRYMCINSTTNTINVRTTKLSKLNNDSEEYDIIHQGASAVNAWVEENIGTIDMFLMTCMFSQNADKDFFSIPKKEQKELLDRVLSLEAIEGFKTLFRESKNAYSLVMENIQSYIDGLTIQTIYNDAPQQLLAMKKGLEEYGKLNEELYHKWNHVSEKDLNTVVSIEDISKEMSESALQLSGIALVDIESMQERRIELKSKYTETGKRLSEVLKIVGKDIELKGGEGDDIEEPESELWNRFISSVQELHNHVLYSKEREKELQTRVMKPADRDSVLASNKSDKELLDTINQFSSWKREQEIIFRERKELLQNPHQALSEIKNTSDMKKTRLRECLVECESSAQKLIGIKNMLLEENNTFKTISDKRPNRPSKTREWIQETGKKISGLNLSEIEKEHALTSDNITKLPIIQERVTRLEEEINQYEELLEKYKNTPFNPSCNACQQQPYRNLVCDVSANKLPESNRLLEEENDKLMAISIGEPENFEELHMLLLEKQTALSNTICLAKEYDNELRIYDTWAAWEKEYVEGKNKVEKLQQEEHTCQGDIHRAEKEIHDIGICLENLGNDISDLEEYISGLDAEKNAIIAEQILDKKWKLLMFNVYECGTTYLSRVTKERDCLLEEIRDIDTHIDQQKVRIKLSARYQWCLTLIEAYPFWKQYKETRIKEELLKKQFSDLEIALAKYSPEFQLTVEEIRNRHKYITILGDAFDGFREWLYKEKLSKMIVCSVNSVLKMICGGELILEAEWLKTIDTLSWFVRNGNNRDSKRCILEKASGFQRFILGIAMRVAISRIGVCKTVFTQMFIDEGFTACDSDNIDKMGGFLRGIMPPGGMYLTTHLEVIKGCADVTIGVLAENGIAALKFGERRDVGDEKAKTGRPKKQKLSNNIK